MAERTFSLGDRVSLSGEGSQRHGTVIEQDVDPPSDRKDLPGRWCRVEFDDGGTEVVNSVDLDARESPS